jgi:hypothetical protein
MNSSFLIRLGLSVSLFVIGWNLEASTLSFIIFSIASGILIYPLFLNKGNEGTSIGNDDYLNELSNEIHKKFHLTCDVLEKIKSPTSKKDLATFLELKGVSLDKYSSYNHRQINLDIGNNWIFSIIDKDDPGISDFHKYNFKITGIKDFQGISLTFDYKEKKREIRLHDFSRLLGANPRNKKILNDMNVGKHAQKLYDLIHKQGNFD